MCRSYPLACTCNGVDGEALPWGRVLLDADVIQQQRVQLRIRISLYQDQGIRALGLKCVHGSGPEAGRGEFPRASKFVA